MYPIRFANTQDVSAIREIMIHVYDCLEDKSWYFIEGNTEEDWIKEHLTTCGFGLVVEDIDAHKIIGFLIVRYPGKDNDNLGLGVYDSEEELMKVAHMETVAVLPAYRGNHLLCKFINKAESFLNPKYTHLMATVHPENYASLGSFIKCGYKIIKEQENKYGEGLPRVILKKDSLSSVYLDVLESR